ncbi:GNAT family N-acetyltransferase [Kutzneria sp. CA-103260]|uniref:GNAT family N-acetyltransferase n=1 Tax=Kutzneria sp. CA-103260 TaxID=2802641 RepID=UPI001BACABF2|nr:GNAT family N-acetyltransferase [Kutzneria sp. CA-103260]
MSDVVLRPAGAGDAAFLTDMLVEAATTPAVPRSRAETLADPSFAHYLPADVGLVAVEQSSQPVGAAWLRLFGADDPGYGFVRDGVPELAIGVLASRRGRGIGRLLVRAIADVARARGFCHICLSVDRVNPAARLYLAEGYRVVASREHADTMLLAL